MSQPKPMPALFVGHGSPMNAIENNRFSKTWQSLPAGFPKPEAILAVSAHWVTDGTCVNNQERPETVYDMYGFPKVLYQHKYPASGSPWLAAQVTELLGNRIKIDNRWGIDHGTWSVLTHMYPLADVPVMQLSLDGNASMEDHYRTGRLLSRLREQGVLVFGSGNVVHNLSLVDWQNPKGEPWADEFDRYIMDCIHEREDDKVIDYRSAGGISSRAFVTTEHFAPLVTVLGSVGREEPVSVFNEERIMGSISMTGYLFG